MFRTAIIVLALLAPPATTAIVTRLQRFPNRFAEVIPGRLYRGGYPSASNVRHLQQTDHIRTILSLTGPVDKPKERDMLAAAGDLGIHALRIPMPGNGCGDFDALDRAADVLNNADNYPIFFHCQAGKQRSNAALAAYRMKHCGWTLEKTLKELEDHYDLYPDKESALVKHLAAYEKHLTADALHQAGRPAGQSGKQPATNR